MAETNPVGGSSPTTWVREPDDSVGTGRRSGDGGVPPANTGAGDARFALTIPTIPPPKIGGLSLEVLVQAVGMEERATVTKSGLESLKAKAQERDEINAKKMEEIQKKLEDMRSKSVLNGFLKAFKIIGLILGAVVAGASLALGVATGNPLLMAAGGIMVGMTVNSILSEATGGKVSISALFSNIATSCGASEETARWIGFGVEIGISLIGCALSLGAGFSAAGAKAAETAVEAGKMAKNVMRIVTLTNKVATVASGVNAFGQGAAQGVSAYYDYRTTNSLAEQKELAAILERIQEAIAMEQDFMQAIMERSNKLLGDVGEIVQQNAEAQTAILGGSAPSMA